ncbi:hypothetical protein [Halalkalibacter akibai]|uniref:Uncharacterized protein n=1 Tax=Halalkalibacter akibai (strain ATCC 43226 / DSM 21942 / CIP 109018 / JCM 9157 / 1139) TaxID=1236973 RepID=W4QZ93_HALA3|nr:hypothetical protein [Halalkalibacter akibai]GAE37232.1 hypothetical protein JCM9157_4500 [Halalkalibacter akibai JCM 9157]
MTLDWFDRVSAELQDNLESICEKYDQIGHMSIDKGAKHPRIEFFVETEELDREYFCTLFFDPFNNEFYIESYDLDLDLTSRTILEDIEDIIDVVHESFHDFMNDDEDDYVVVDEYDSDDVHEEDKYYLDDEEEDDDYETLDVEWETPEVTAYIDDEEALEITYKFGVIQETGDGILQRINRVRTEDDDLIKDEFNFIFSKDEASTIIAMIASHMDSIKSLDTDY